MSIASEIRPTPLLREVRYDSGVWRSLVELWARRDLLRALVARDLQVRYRNSILGFFWSLLTPLLQMLIFTFVVKYAFRAPIPNASVNILIGLVAWAYLESGLLDCCDVIVTSRELVKKIYLPRPALPLAAVLGNLVHMLLSLSVLLVWLAAIGDYPKLLFVLIVPLVIIESLVVAGLGMMVAAAHTYYRDIKFALAQLLRLMFFLTPVMYTSAIIGKTVEGTRYAYLHRLYMYNPLATIIESYRQALLLNTMPDLGLLLPAALVAVGIFFAGFYTFVRASWKFPELL